MPDPVATPQALTASAGALASALQAASVDPGPASVAGVILLIGVLPLGGIPMTGVCMAASAVLPRALSIPVTMAGILLNTGLAWSLARSVFGARLERWLERRGGALGAVRDGARRQPLKWAILVRFLPAPFLAGPMVLASTGVGLGTTLLGSFIAMAPWCFAYAWLASAGRQGDLKAIAAALAGLALMVLLAAFLKRRLMARPAQARLSPRREGGPQLKLYTLPGQDLSDEARADLAGLRDELGFEVDERPLDASADPADLKAYVDHAPVALFDGHKLFNFKMDENVLRVRLKEWRARQGGAA